ncbi:MAG: DUF4397 domain-containing protein [Chitinophagaceae bacterium]|nr:DUF4397 domain-containing protein [Chitinophagaceae bacterium]
MRSYLVAAIALLSTGIIFSSCSKNKDNGPQPPAAGVLAFNLAPDQPGISVRLSGNAIHESPIMYGNYTGAYRAIYTGDRPVESFDYSSMKPLGAAVNFTFLDDKSYSVFVVGAANKYKNVVTLDDVDSTEYSSGSAYVRYINAIVDSTQTADIAVKSGGNAVVNDNAAYTHVSDFKAIPAGDISITFKNGNLDLSRTINVQANKVYTILLMGLPGAGTDAAKPQIKFVENGVLDSAGR